MATADRTLYLTREGAVVEAGDRAAFQLFVREGCELNTALLGGLGMEFKDGKVVFAKPEKTEDATKKEKKTMKQLAEDDGA